MLAGLAHFGALRLSDFLEMGTNRCLDRRTFTNFQALGIFVVYGNPRKQMVAFNEAFPGLEALRKLLVMLEPKPRNRPQREILNLPIPLAALVPLGQRDLFGPWRQTATILTIGVAGGEMSLGDIAIRLKSIGTKPQELRETLDALEKRKLLEVGDKYAVLRQFAGADLLVDFAREYTSAMPEYKLVPHVKNKDDPIEPRGRTAFLPGALGLPQLFGRHWRTRALLTLAVHGSMRRTDFSILTGLRNDAFDKLFNDGWLTKASDVSKNLRRVNVDIAEVPGRQLLVRLLQKMAQRWEVVPPTGLMQLGGRASCEKSERFAIGRYFGSSARSEVLLTVAAMGQADLAMLARAIPVHDRQELTRAVNTFVAYGILRRCRFDGTRRGFELDHDWFAAHELRALLRELVKAEKRYQARAASVESVMPVKRLSSRTKPRLTRLPRRVL